MKEMSATEIERSEVERSETLRNPETSGHQRCWKQIGVWGSSDCEKLAQVAHCHHCSVYTAAGSQLLQRATPVAYRAQQTQQISAVQQREDASALSSVLIFRLAQEWLALPAGLCQQILPPIAHHTLPHRSNATLLGIVNVRGQLLLKVSLLAVLGLNGASLRSTENRPENRSKSRSETNDLSGLLANKTQIYSRMVVLEKPTEIGEVDTWVFDVDELYGIHSVALSQLAAAAAGVNAAIESCTRQVFSWQGQPVNFLNDVRLFEALRQQAL